MVEHISNERLAALLDDGVEDASAREHLDDCSACRREMDLLRRMRMALSAMDPLEPPADQWERIEASLPTAGSDAAAGSDATPLDDDAGRVRDETRGPRGAGRTGGGARGFGGWVRDIGWLRAAAGIVLFAGGLGLGSVLGPLPGAGGGSSSGGATEAAAGPTEEATAAATRAGTTEAAATPAASGTERASDRAGEPGDLDADEILSELEVLASGDFDPRQAYRNPTAAAERLARLDALVRAAREALEEEPADPAMNQLLFQVVEERQQLNRALHQASIDYR